MRRKSIAFMTAALIFFGMSLAVSRAATYTRAEIEAMFTFDKISIDSESNVKSDLALISDFYGWSVAWSSLPAGYVSTGGQVSRPDVGAGDADVTLTAVLKKTGEADITAAFNITIAAFRTQRELAEAACASLTFDSLSADPITAVKNDLVLPSEWKGAKVIWKTDDPSILTVLPDGANYIGRLNKLHFAEGTYAVRLTAVVISGDAFAERSFLLSIAEYEIGRGYTAALKSAVDKYNYDFLRLNNIFGQRQDIVLPAPSDSAITARVFSDRSDTITNDGRVTRSLDMDRRVVLTVILNNGYEETKLSYSVLVPAYGNDDTAAYVREDLEWALNLIKMNCSTGAIMGNLILPKTGPNGSVLTWISSNEVVVTNNGVVTRQSNDTPVMLYLTASLFGNAEEGELPLKVKALASTPAGAGGGTGGGSFAGGGGFSAGPVPDNNNNIFSDLPAEHWAAEAIGDLYRREIVNGKGDGLFAPDDYITREEIVKILVEILSIQPGGYITPFTDVIKGQWYYEYVTTAERAGITNGISEDLFGVGRFITRQDLATMLFRAMYPYAEETSETRFNDREDVSEYARNAVDFMYMNGIIRGDENGNFNPATFATRAEAVAMIHRILKGRG